MHAPTLSRTASWHVEHHDVVTSTQALARGRPAWSAVVAREQSAGRGQAGRSFVSGPGGLYVTGIVPYSGVALESRGFALAVGWAVRESLRRSGVRRLRLRWPNDLMVGSLKVGGILVEQGGPDTLLVGVGLNVSNQPWLADRSLAGIAGRLVDAAPPGILPPSDRLADLVLRAIRIAHHAFVRRRLAGFVPILNRCWGRPREVEIEPAMGVHLVARHGRFHGIDREGCIMIETRTGAWRHIPAHHVGRLRETVGA